MPITKRYLLAWRNLCGRSVCRGTALVGMERSMHSLRMSILFVGSFLILVHNQGGHRILVLASQAQLEPLPRR